MDERRDELGRVLSAAVEEFSITGYISQERLEYWLREIRRAALSAMQRRDIVEMRIRGALQAIYDRLVLRGQLLKRHEGASAFTFQLLQPKFRQDLDRAILASASLIKLNRLQATEKTLQRFAGWATSVPKGGSRAESRVDIKTDLKKPIADLSFLERRVAIDQGHKFAASLNQVMAQGSGAIAFRWRSHWRQLGYNYRPDHKERDQKIYLIPGTWAVQKGLVKPGAAGYADKITQPGEEVYCRCYAVYLYALSQLPDDMLTAKGRDARERAIIAA